jgi:lipid II:glycine glycyltransferase (peptidoglycan interpeptide bridge formation enzyme)
MPFSDECALNGINAETFALLFRRLFALGAKRRWKHYECRGGRGALGDVPSSVSFHGHKLSLEQDSDRLFARLQGAARTAVRKAQNSALTIEAATSMAAMKSFYDLLCQTRRKHGVPPQPLRFFENIHRYIIEKQQGIVILAKSGVVPVAGAIFFSFGDTAVYKFAASNEAFRHTQGNNLVLWEGMRHYAKQGLKVLDFGRTSLNNPGLRRFKLAWGSQEHRIDYFRYDFSKNIFSRDTKDRSSGWHAPLFKVLPTKISRLAGLALYPHLA